MLNFSEYQALTKTNQINNINNVKEKEIGDKVSNPEQIVDDKKVLVADPSQMVIPKKKLALALSATAVIGAAIAVAVGKNQTNKLQDSLALLKKQLAQAPSSKTVQDLNDTISDLTAKNQADVKTISQLQEKIAELAKSLEHKSVLSADVAQETEIKLQKYRDELASITSIYEDAKAPDNFEIKKWYALKSFDFKKAEILEGSKTKNSFIENLLDKFKQEGKVEIPKKAKVSATEDIEKAKIQFSDDLVLGKPQGTSLLTDYGNTSNWSDEKIARDILQNFYDGNGHSLDDAGILVEKLSNGNYKIKISGNGVFNHQSLELLGATSKKDPYDAGGFGEGVKVCVANMLAKNKTQEVRFRSADWDLLFDSNNKRIRTTLNQASDILDGNFVEFETSDENFAKQIIKAMDYFKHSNNSDFKNLTYDGKSFGFKILKPDEKGNFYLTQRFEYGDQQAWENNVEGLDIIFKRKPDDKIYKEITGHSFNVGRDRSEMSPKDIYELTKCFAKEMSDEELVESVLSTQIHWDKLEKNKESAIKSFIHALNDEASKRNIGIDFDKAKICVMDHGTNETVYRAVANAGYNIVSGEDCGFYYVGMPKATDIFHCLSNHKALEPTVAEAKKLKILEKATKVIQENFSLTYTKKAKSIFSSISADDIKIQKKVPYDLKEMLEKLPDLKLSPDAYGKGLNSFSDEILNEEKFNKEIYEYLNKKINGLNVTNINDDDSKKVLEFLSSLMELNSGNNELLKQYSIQIKNLQIINPNDVVAPRFIFDRKNELAKTTLGEAILNTSNHEKVYSGHWIDRNYLNNGNFYDLLATWMHEICHKSGGDGTSEFTYKLTDMIESLLGSIIKNSNSQSDILALEKLFNEIK